MSLLRYAISYIWQVFQTLILQEGEKGVLKSVASLVNQGIYGVVNNLGTFCAAFCRFSTYSPS